MLGNEWVAWEDFDEEAFKRWFEERGHEGSVILSRMQCGNGGTGPGCGGIFVGWPKDRPARCPACGTLWNDVNIVGVSPFGEPGPFKPPTQIRLDRADYEPGDFTRVATQRVGDKIFIDAGGVADARVRASEGDGPHRRLHMPGL